MQGNVYIADSTNHRIQKFAPGVPGWRQVNINGFGDRNNWGVLALEIFKGDLYAGTRNPVIGATVWRTTNGATWKRVSEPGFSNAFGSTNSMVWDFATFGDQLYATAASDGNGRGQLWRTEDGSTWSQIVNAGFGDSDDTGVRALAAWGDMFYACTYNPVSGAEIWRSNTGDSGTWSRVVSGGNGNSANYICTGFQEFNGYLYTALENESTGAQVWRTADGSTWSPVVARWLRRRKQLPDRRAGCPRRLPVRGHAQLRDCLHSSGVRKMGHTGNRCSRMGWETTIISRSKVSRHSRGSSTCSWSTR